MKRRTMQQRRSLALKGRWLRYPNQRQREKARAAVSRAMFAQFGVTPERLMERNPILADLQFVPCDGRERIEL